jgi:NADH-quinone oxidoreductase subunit K
VLSTSLFQLPTSKTKQTMNVTQAIQGIPLNHYIWLSSALFAIGVMGVLFRRNAIIIFMCIELMLNAVNLLLVAFSSYRGDATGQVFVFFIMAVAAAEVAVGLAILIVIYNNSNTTDINVLNKLKW